MTIHSFLKQKCSRATLLGAVLTVISSLSAVAATNYVALSWNANTESDLSGYNVYFGTASRTYSGYKAVSNTTTNTSITNLTPGTTYYFAVTAKNTADQESGYSGEISYNVPVPVNNPPVANSQSVSATEDVPKAITLSGSDPDGNPITFTVLTQPTKGTLSGTAPNLTYTPSTNYNGSDSFTFRVSDGSAISATATVSITIAAVNDAPVANSQSVTVTEDIAKAITLSGSDVEGSALTYTVVSQPTKGILSGTAPNLTYTPNTNANGSDSFTFRVNDGSLNSGTATVSINITPVNDAPVANSQSVTTLEDTAKAVTLSGSDVDGDSLTYTIVAQPTKGTLSGTAPNLIYTPNANYNGSDSFTFRVNDGTVNSSTATVSITVTAVNDPPVADNQSVSALEDIAKAITLTGSDVDGDTLTYSVVNPPSNGTLSGTAPNLTYLGNTNYYGSDSFTFRVNDGKTNSALATVTITITAVNQSPVASSQSVTTPEDTAKAITLVASDPDNNPLTYTIVASPAHGSLSGTAPNVTYTPAANYNGPDSFTFKVNDGKADSATVTVSLNITAVNDAPVANAQSTSTLEDTAKAITLTGSDVDGDSITFVVVTGPAHGTLSGVAPNLIYTPTANYSGPDTFTFKVNDGKTDSATALVSISVTPVNDAPLASAQSVTTAEDNAKAITLAGTDPDGDTLTYSIVAGPAHGTLTGTAPNVTYRPATNYNGSDSFTFKVNDGTVDSPTAVVSITVTPVNDAPIAAAQAVGTDRNVAKAITLTGSDVDGDSLTFSIASQPGKGVLSGTAPNLIYTPNNNVTGTDSFTFRVNDGLLNSAVATVSINIAQGPNTVPVANAQSATTAEDTAKAITLTGSDADDDALTFAIVTPPAHGVLSGTAPNMTYSPAANYNGSDSFTFKANDGTADSAIATVSLTVTPVNDAPVANAQSVTTVEDTAKAIVLTGSDVDGDSLNFAVVSGPSHGSLSGSAPNLIYTPVANYNGSDSFTFRANDGTTNSALATVSVNITPANDAPVANAQSVTTAEDTAKAITLTGSDIDGDTLTFIIVTQPAHGALTGSGANRTYTPATDYNGSDSFTFKVNDGNLDSPTVTVSITVSPANDAPVASSQSVTTLEDTAKAITLAGSDSDGDTLTYNIVTQPTHGALTGTAPNVTYTPSTNYFGADSFTFRVNDGTTNSAPATVSITVTPVNDAPIASAQSVTTDEDTAKAITLSATDADGDALTYIIVATPTKGSLSGSGANLTYTPTANVNGADSFSFKVNDGTVDSGTVVVSISITAVNDTPVANNQTIGTERDVAKNITLTGSDVDGDTLTFAVVTPPAKGVLSGAAPNLTYTPNSNVTGSDSFTFRVNDGTVNSALATVTINIATGPNRAPVAIAQTVTTAEDTAKAIVLTATDEDGDALTFTVVGQPAHGSLGGTAPNLTFTPTANYNGSDSFTFRASDGTTNSAVVTVSITITAVNDIPIANGQSISTPEDTAKAVTLTATDADGDTLSYSIVTSPAHGVLSGTIPNLIYTPTGNYHGADSFTFKVNDGTADSVAALVSINVTAVNDIPVAEAQDVTTAEDTAKAIALVATDADGDTLTYVITTPPAHGTLTGTAPNLIYTPATNYHGADTFWFKVNDGTADSALVVVSINVTPVNDIPVAIGQTLATDKNVAKSITLTGTDVDGDTLTFSVATQPTKGVLSGSAPNLTYTPNNNVTGLDSFTFKANDGTTNSAAATISINIAPGPNTAPTAIAQSITTPEDTAKALTLTGSDVDGDTLSFSVVTPPTHGTVSGTPPNLTYTPALNYYGDDSFWFRANDGSTNSAPVVVSITVSSVNDAPTANSQSISAVGGTAKAITLTGSDVEGDPLTFIVLTQPTHGTLTGSGANLSYTAIKDYSGSDSFTFRTSDGTDNSATATVSINVSPAPNTTPIASAQSVTTAEDTAKAITLAGTDADGDALTYVIVTQPAHGSLSGSGPNITYTPATNYFGSDSFTFRVNDGKTNSLPATVSLSISPVNDAPTLNAIANVTVNEGSGATAVALSGISAGPNESQMLSVTATSSNPTLVPTATVVYSSPAATGTLNFTPAATGTGTAQITVTVNDGQSANNTFSQTFTVTVQEVVSPITLDPIADVTVEKSAAQQSVELTGISTKEDTSTSTSDTWVNSMLGRLSNNKGTIISISAASSNTKLVPTPVIAYNSPNSKGTLSFAPAPNVSGTATITVTVTDGKNAPLSRSFTVTVKDMNAAPTLDAIANVTLAKNSGLKTVQLTGISAGAGESQTLVVTASSSNPGLIPTPKVTYSSPSSTGSLSFTPVTDASGTAVITVTVNDGQAENNITTRAFTVMVSSDGSAPTIALTLPTTGSQFTAPESIKLAADVVANGHTINKVQFYAGATLLGESTTAPFSALWDCDTAGTFSLVARASYDSGDTVDSPAVTVSVTDSGLPAPWETADIGNALATGSVRVEQDNFSIRGAGQIDSTEDSFRFVYQPLTADGEIWVRLADLPTGNNACAGVMIRESLSSASRFVFVCKLADGNIQVRSRTTTGGPITCTSVAGGKPADWIRLVRKNDMFVAGYGKKAGSWSIGSILNATMAPNIYIGLAVASGDPAILAPTTFVAPAVDP